MPTETASSGVVVTVPDTIQVRFERAELPETRRAGPTRTRGPVPIDNTAAGDLDTMLVDILRAQHMEVVETVVLDAKLRPDGARSAPAAASQARLSVPLDPEEDAVVLVEQEEVYSWAIPVRRNEAPAGSRAARSTTADFELALSQRSQGPSGQRSVLVDAAISFVRARVFRFIGRRLVGAAVRVQERSVAPGLIALKGLDPAQWKTTGSIAIQGAKSGDRHRVLLLVHGTFSSTAGCFGQLAPTPWGKSFLEACFSHYDMVLGYDHKTLSDSPEENAAALLEAIKDLQWGAAPPEIDIITHSRGGLVVRSLVEALAPNSAWKATFRRAICVATTNTGTALAKPEHWKEFLDLYTNLAVAACRALTLLPNAAPIAVILRQSISLIAEFVQQIPMAGLDASIAPGLEAMVPTSDLVKRLNQLQSGQFTANNSIYYVISSSFIPQLLEGDHEPKEFPKRLLQLLASGAVTQLMKDIPNDLVVDTGAMSAIDTEHGQFVRDTLHFGASPQIYHTNYFSRPEVVNVLTRWLELPQPAAPSTRGGTRGRSRTPASETVSATLPSIATSHVLPAAVEADILVRDAHAPANEVTAAVIAKSPRFVVLKRIHIGQHYWYALSPNELIQILDARGHMPVSDTLDLHGWDRSDTATIKKVAADAAAGRPVFSAQESPFQNRLRRTVVVEDDKAVGVIPNASEVVINADIGSLARAIEGTDLALYLEAMPSFRVPPGTRPSPSREINISNYEAPRPLHGLTRSARRPAASSRKPPEPTAPSPSLPRAEFPADNPTSATYHFLAEMKREVKLNKRVTVEVTVSREMIEAKLGESGRATGTVALDRKIIIDVIPKRGFESVDETDHVEIDPPAPNDPQPLYFRLEAVSEGAGEVWVIARQGHMPIATIKLYPTVVASNARARGNATRSESTANQYLGPDPEHTLRIIELDKGPQGTVFRFELQSPSIGLKRYFSNTIKTDRRQYVENIYSNIETRWTVSQAQKKSFDDELRDVGFTLWNELLPEALQRDLWANRNQLDNIFVLSEEPFIPWELLLMVEPGKPRRTTDKFLAEIGLVRWLYEAEATPPTTLVVRKSDAYYIVPAYPPVAAINLQPLPHAQLEIAFLKNRFGASAILPNGADVTNALSIPETFDLLHFAGHGFAGMGVVDKPQLMLEGAVSGSEYYPDYLDANHVKAISNFGSKRPIAVLNACQAGRSNWQLTAMGGFAQAFLFRRAGMFVGTLWSVGDFPARTFTEALYTALLRGDNVAKATRKARAAAKLAGDPTWLAYAIYAHPGATLRFLPADQPSSTTSPKRSSAGSRRTTL